MRKSREEFWRQKEQLDELRKSRERIEKLEREIQLQRER